MIDGIVHFETSDEKFSLVFNFNVMDKIQTEYGSIKKWQELVIPPFHDESRKLSQEASKKQVEFVGSKQAKFVNLEQIENVNLQQAQFVNSKQNKNVKPTSAQDKNKRSADNLAVDASNVDTTNANNTSNVNATNVTNNGTSNIDANNVDTSNATNIYTNNATNFEPNFSALKFFLCEAINEGILIENEQRNENRALISQSKAGRLISEIGFEKITVLFSEAMKQSMPKRKNAQTTKNQKK